MKVASVGGVHFPGEGVTFEGSVCITLEFFQTTGQVATFRRGMEGRRSRFQCLLQDRRGGFGRIVSVAGLGQGFLHQGIEPSTPGARLVGILRGQALKDLARFGEAFQGHQRTCPREGGDIIVAERCKRFLGLIELGHHPKAKALATARVALVFKTSDRAPEGLEVLFAFVEAGSFLEQGAKALNGV
ncbi:MAG: hypothetical protein CMJ86_05470 [Planctomycetes bacterium]|nr:hypothetical protein [Planctomycetota bacterium]